MDGFVGLRIVWEKCVVDSFGTDSQIKYICDKFVFLKGPFNLSRLNLWGVTTHPLTPAPAVVQ